jgi:hypothetical protein
MASQIEFYFDFASPYAISLPPAAGVQRSHWRRDRLPAVSPSRADEDRGQPANHDRMQNKGKYASADIGRWAARYKVQFSAIRTCAVSTCRLGPRALVAIDQGRGADYVDAVYRAIWAGSKTSPTQPSRGPSRPSRLQWRLAATRGDQTEYAARLDRQTSKLPNAACSAHRPSSFAIRCSSATTGDFVIDAAKAAT